MEKNRIKIDRTTEVHDEFESMTLNIMQVISKLNNNDTKPEWYQIIVQKIEL